MSDINLQFTWWQLALALLGYKFWPITAVAALAAIWVWRRRASWAARICAIVVGALWTLSGVTSLSMTVARMREGAAYSASLRARQHTFTQEVVVAGSRLPPGTVVTRSAEGEPDEVVAVDLPFPAEIHGVPLVGHVPLSGGALNGDVTLARDSRIGQALCSAREGARFESGKLTSCFLAEPSRIRGVPCSGNVDLQNGVVCTLAAGYRRFGFDWRAQTKLTDLGDLVWFRTGRLAPSLYLFGSPLSADSEVEFNRGHIASVDVRSHPARFQGCTIDLVLVDKGAVSGRPVGACGLPEVPPGNVALPSTALRPHADLR